MVVDGQCVRAGPVVTGRLRLQPLAAGYAVPSRDYLAFMIPLKWQGDYLYNGRLATRTSLFLSADGSGYFTRGEGRDTMAVGIRRDAFRRAFAAILGPRAEEIPIENLAIDLPASASLALRRSILGYHQRVARFIEHLPSPDMLEQVAEELVLALAETVSQSRQIPPERTRNATALQIVRKAENHWKSVGCKQVTLTDLCLAAGVGSTALTAAFNEIYGEPPKKIIRLRRLMNARSQLLLKPSERGSIKGVAITCGFEDAGRFAQIYDRLFGELPSTTLQKWEMMELTP